MAIKNNCLDMKNLWVPNQTLGINKLNPLQKTIIMPQLFFSFFILIYAILKFWFFFTLLKKESTTEYSLWGLPSCKNSTFWSYMEEIKGLVDFERYTIRCHYYGNLLHLLGECHAFLAWKTSQKYSMGLSKVENTKLGKGQKRRTRTFKEAWPK